MLKQTAILLSAKPYRIADQTTGEVNSGVSIQYYPDDSLSPYTDPVNPENVGMRVIDDSVPYELLAQIVKAPALYELSCRMVSAKNARGQSKAQLKVVGLSFVCDLMPAAKK